MAPILTIFGPNRSRRRDLFFEKFSNERRRHRRLVVVSSSPSSSPSSPPSSPQHNYSRSQLPRTAIIPAPRTPNNPFKKSDWSPWSHLTAKGGLATGGVERNFFENFSVLAGGPPDPPLKRSFVTFDRGGQTGPPRSNDFFFGAADDTCAADDLPCGRPA